MRVKSIHIYPIKATHAVDLAEAVVEERGLAGDRRWMLVDAGGKFITQREYPALAKIQAELTRDGLKIAAPGRAALFVKNPETAAQPAALWGDPVLAHPAEEAAHAWFSDFLGVPCSLVWQGDNVRPTSEKWSQEGDQASFADGFPLLVATTASLEDLNARLEKPVPMNRFRPNIVIDSDAPWDEDGWRTLKIGDVELELVKPCTRCVVTTTDQDSGEKEGREPLATLAKFRLVGDENLKGVLFGENAIPRRLGLIRVNDKVEVTARKAPPKLKPAKDLKR